MNDFQSGSLNAEQAQLADALALTADGDREALKSLYESTSAKLFGICLRISQDREVAEDILQEVYIKVWRRAGRFDATKASPMTWLATIARNSAIDAIRRRRPEQGDDADLAGFADDRPLPDREAESRQIGVRIEECLDQLDRRQRDCVRHAYLDGLSYSQVATRTGTPLGTIKGWMNRALRALRECLRD